MGKVTSALMGETVSRSTVSRVTKSLEEKVDALRKEPLTQRFPYLYLDATFLDARWARAVENVSALVAYGVGEDGHRQLLAITIGPSESQDSWADLLRQLLERGLSGVQLVIADGHAGLAAAARQALPEARLQRCTVHLTRNVLAKAPWRLRGRLGRETSAIFEAATPKDARARLDALVAGLGKQVPEAMECLTEGFTAATQFFAFPKAHWKRLRSTNGLERLHGEVKRRIRSVGAFPDRASALRLITAVALQVTGIWDDRRYLDMSLLYPPEAKAA
jgi:transposase-like protein